MNKLVKASVSAGAAIALLLGGAGTLAYWNDSATVSAGIVTAGELSVSSAGAAAAWTANGQPVQNPAAFRIVPGDILVMTKDLRVVANGDNLKAELSVDYNSLVDVVSSQADINLGTTIIQSGNPSIAFTSAVLPPQFSVTPSQVNGVDNQVVTIIPGASGFNENVTATVTFTFPASAGNNTKNGQLDLNKIRVIFEQFA